MRKRATERKNRLSNKFPIGELKIVFRSQGMFSLNRFFLSFFSSRAAEVKNLTTFVLGVFLDEEFFQLLSGGGSGKK